MLNSVEHYEDLPDVHPTVLATDQVCQAMSALDRRAEEYLRWPFPVLDALTGPLGAGGQVWFVCAYSGAGKTTFIASCVLQWQGEDKKVYVMPLETRPHVFRTYLACMALGIPPGDVLSGNLSQMPDGAAKRAAIRAELLRQAKAPYSDRVMVSGVPAIDLAGLTRGLKEAKAFGANVVIVDHIDHLEGHERATLYEASRMVNQAAARMAQDNELTLLFTSQLNTQTVLGNDHLARWQPPRDQHVLFGNLKRHVATGMIGLFRKIRDRRSSETDKEYRQLIKAARAGTLEPMHILEPNTIGVNAMKLRYYGGREGSHVCLGFDQGRITNLNEKDQHSGAPGYQP